MFPQAFTVMAVSIGTLGLVGTISMDLSKAYKYLLHKLLIVKLETYIPDNDRLTVLTLIMDSKVSGKYCFTALKVAH